MSATNLNLTAICWLWRDWIARGKIHVLAGPPGTGKTTVAMALGATVSQGGLWPDGSPAQRGDVLIWSGEDDPSDTLLPRLMAAGADLSRVHFVKGTWVQGKIEPFDPAAELPLLSLAIEQLPGLRLIIVDPLVSAVAGDSHKNSETRRALQPLVDLACKHQVAVLGITHLSKGTEGKDPLERVSGSLAFGALPRVVMMTAGSARRGARLVRVKSNIGVDGGGFEYKISEVQVGDEGAITTSTVEFGDQLCGTPRELVEDADRQAQEGSWQVGSVEQFLLELLHVGGVPARDVFSAGGKLGFTEKALRSGLAAVGGRTTKEPGVMAGKWVWSLN